jgi:hypothetical protein
MRAAPDLDHVHAQRGGGDRMGGVCGLEHLDHGLVGADPARREVQEHAVGCAHFAVKRRARGGDLLALEEDPGGGVALVSERASALDQDALALHHPDAMPIADARGHVDPHRGSGLGGGG